MESVLSFFLPLYVVCLSAVLKNFLFIDVFTNLIIIHLVTVYFLFLLLEVYSESWDREFISIGFGKFCLLFLQTLFTSPHLLFSGTPVTRTLFLTAHYCRTGHWCSGLFLSLLILSCVFYVAVLSSPVIFFFCNMQEWAKAGLELEYLKHRVCSCVIYFSIQTTVNLLLLTPG